MTKKVIIIAEAGVNHNGSLRLAKKLVKAAAMSGADYVKFQTFKTEKIVSRLALKANYQLSNTNDNLLTQFEMLKKLELSEQDHFDLIMYSKKCGIKFLSTGFDEDSVDFLDNFKLDLFKIPSGEITNKPYLVHIAQKRKKVILSTGMSDLSEIKNAIDILVNNGLEKNMITVLHCNTQYPTPFMDVNLLAMNNIKENLNINIGYSDHTLGIEVPIAAVALGATVIEKHFTLDKTMNGPDHLTSLKPKELNQMVKAIRNIEYALSGDGIKKISDSERENLTLVRKSLHYNVDLNPGDFIRKEHLISLRPGDGISPMEIENIIGKKLKIIVKAKSMVLKSNFYD